MVTNIFMNFKLTVVLTDLLFLLLMTLSAMRRREVSDHCHQVTVPSLGANRK